jgi:hypothetical protein
MKTCAQIAEAIADLKKQWQQSEQKKLFEKELSGEKTESSSTPKVKDIYYEVVRNVPNKA